MYLVFSRMPGESYRRRLGPLLLCSYDFFRAFINSLKCCFKKREKKMGMGVGEEVSKSLGVLRPVNLYGYISAIKKKKKK